MATLYDLPRSDLPAAEYVRHVLRDAGVAAVALRGGPGCGKTRLIEATLRNLPEIRFAVISAADDPDDRVRFRSLCEQVVELQVQPETPPTPFNLAAALDRLDLHALDIILFEDASPIPQSDDLGVSSIASVFSVAGGSDKPAKHPELLRDASMVVLNKIDLLPHSPFDLHRFRDDVSRIAPTARLVELSALEHQNLRDWLDWMASHAPPERRTSGSLPAEFFFG